jgi:OOP family OmpA-OmpF porin
MYKRLGMTAFATLALMGAMAAQADTQPGFYAGAGIGSTKVGDDFSGVDDSDTGFKIFGGYNFNANWGIEGTYFDFGEASVSAGNSSASVGVTGLSAAAVGRLPVSDMFAVYAKLGFASYDVDVNFRNVQGFGSGHLSGALGFGGNFEARLEYEALNVDGDASMISISGLFRF